MVLRLRLKQTGGVYECVEVDNVLDFVFCVENVCANQASAMCYVSNGANCCMTAIATCKVMLQATSWFCELKHTAVSI